jgi:hypothetical protein
MSGPKLLIMTCFVIDCWVRTDLVITVSLIYLTKGLKTVNFASHTYLSVCLKCV